LTSGTTNQEFHRPMLRNAVRSVFVASLALHGGCDRVKQAVSAGPAVAGDPVWHGDSALLAGKPTVLFRTFAHEKGRAIAPIATIGTSGFRQLRLGPRGWRAFDVSYLRDGSTLTALRDGRSAGSLRTTRGMWENSGQLDSIPRCNIIPAGLTDASATTILALAGRPFPLKLVSALSSGELQEAVANVPTLIAPSVGIAVSKLSSYRREVHVLATGISSRPSILVTYDDPEQVSDTLQPATQRPRQLVVVLDKGVYGYRPSFKFATLGNALSEPRITFLDYVDIDNDGRAEIFLGFKYRHVDQLLDATKALHYENDAWREIFKESVRCP
jgi:hypothetical protein